MKTLKDELIFKKEMLPLLQKYNNNVKLNDIIIIGFHYHKLTYNFLYNGKKYVYKKNLRLNNIEDSSFMLRYFDEVYNEYREKLNNINVYNKEDMEKWIINNSYKFIEYLLSNDYNSQKNLIERLEFNDDFIIYKYYNLKFYDDDDFMHRQEQFKILWKNEVTPICLGRGNVGYINTKDNFIMYDIDLLTINNPLGYIFIHNEMDDDECWLKPKRI
jgi:hypothetical protein